MSEDKVSEDTSVENASPEPEADAETQESEAESTPAVEPNDKEKSDSQKTGDAVSKRIKQLTDKVRSGKQASDSQIFELRQENERLQGELKSRPKTQEPLKTLEDFDHNEDKFNEYQDKRTVAIATDAASEAVSKVQTQIESSQVESKFKTRESAFESKVGDYVDAVYGDKSWAASAEMADEIRLSDIGPEIAYHLAKNPEKAAELSVLSPRETVRQMTLLEAELKSEKSKKGKSVSNAPPPPPKLPSGDAGLEKKITDSGLSNAEFAKMRRKQIANR